MTRIDPYKHEERWNRWKERTANGIPDISKKNSDIIKQYLQDMEHGLNISGKNKKGSRSYTRLNSLRQRMMFLSKKFSELYEIDDITKINERTLHIFFSGMRNGTIKRVDGGIYKDPANFVKVFKAFWHWHMTLNRKIGKEIEDITITAYQPKAYQFSSTISSMKLIIVRHGETEENKREQLQGQLLQGTLNEEGTLQAKKLANRLKKEKIDIIYSSPLKRALDTARIIGKFHPEAPIKTDKRIMERALGNFEGMNIKEFLSLNLDIDDETLMKKEKVETMEKMRNRVENFIQELKKKKGTILICGHFWINTAINKYLLSMEKKTSKYQNIPNASMFVFELKNNSFVQKISGCDRHLDD